MIHNTPHTTALALCSTSRTRQPLPRHDIVISGLIQCFTICVGLRTPWIASAKNYVDSSRSPARLRISFVGLVSQMEGNGFRLEKDRRRDMSWKATEVARLFSSSSRDELPGFSFRWISRMRSFAAILVYRRSFGSCPSSGSLFFAPGGRMIRIISITECG